MTSRHRYALITGSSRGIGRGIAIKLAGQGTTVAVHYFRNRAAAEETLAQIRRLGADGLLVQADVTRSGEALAMIRKVQAEFGGIDVFVANARPEAPEFFYPPLAITEAQWDAAFDSQVKGFLFSAREAARHMREGGRIIAITHTNGGRTGSLAALGGDGIGEGGHGVRGALPCRGARAARHHRQRGEPGMD